MEGYVRLKLKFSIVRVWMVLDAQQLTYYESLDLVEQTPKNLKGSLHIKSYKVSKFNDTFKGIKHGILLDKDKAVFSFDCDDPATCSLWFNSLSRAININIEDEESMGQSIKFRSVLGIDSQAKITIGDIARAYKKLCLKEHPDKGGNVENFNKINLAYNALMSIQKEADERERSDIIHFEAIVEKGTKGGGLGLVVAEDKLRKQVVVQKLEDSITIVGLTEEAEGEIRPGDAVIGIDKDDCSHWYLSRIRARLGAFRVPPGSQIHFTFERRVPKAELMSEDSVQPKSPVRKHQQQQQQQPDISLDTESPKFSDTPPHEPVGVRVEEPFGYHQSCHSSEKSSTSDQSSENQAAGTSTAHSSIDYSTTEATAVKTTAIPSLGVENNPVCVSQFNLNAPREADESSQRYLESQQQLLLETQANLERCKADNEALQSRVAGLESLLIEAESTMHAHMLASSKLQEEVVYLNGRVAALTKIIAQNELQTPLAAPVMQQHQQQQYARDVQRLNQKLAEAYDQIRDKSLQIARLTGHKGY